MKLRLDDTYFSFEQVEDSMESLYVDAIKLRRFNLGELAVTIENDLHDKLLPPQPGVYCNLLEDPVAVDITTQTVSPEGQPCVHILRGYQQLCYFKGGQMVDFNHEHEVSQCRFPMHYKFKEGNPRVLPARWQIERVSKFDNRPFSGSTGLKLITLYARYEIDNNLAYMPPNTGLGYLEKYIRWPDRNSEAFKNFDNDDFKDYNQEYAWSVHRAIERHCSSIRSILENFLQGYSQHIVSLYRNGEDLYVAIKEDHRARLYESLYESLLREIQKNVEEGRKGISIDSRGLVYPWG